MSPAAKSTAKGSGRAAQSKAKRPSAKAASDTDASTQAALAGYHNWSNQPQPHGSGLAQFQMWVIAFHRGVLQSTSSPTGTPTGRILS